MFLYQPRRIVNFVILSLVQAAVKWNPQMKSFTHSVKQGGCSANQEISLFEYTKGPGIITEQWYTGKGCIDENTILRYYIDGDEEPSIEVNLYMAHGIGLPGKGAKGHRFKSAMPQPENDLEEESVMSLRRRYRHIDSSERESKPKEEHAENKGFDDDDDDDDDDDESKYLREKFHRTSRITPEESNQSGTGENENREKKTLNVAEESSNPLKHLFQGSESLTGEGSSGTTDNKAGAGPVPSKDIASQAKSRSEPKDAETDPGIPWGTKRLGHLAENGGIYNTIRVPFQKSIYISIIATRHGHYWYNVRGVRNYPLIIGDLELPKTARLNVYKHENETVLPFHYIFLATSVNKSGLLYMTTFNSESENLSHQEACFRVIIDNDTEIQYLSSGTEDLFLSAYYYNGGIFHTDHAGLSYKDEPGRVCAYKFFEDDPVLFNSAFSLIWRCGELADNQCFKIYQKDCTRKYGSKECVTKDDYEAAKDFDKINKKKTKPTVIYAYTWVYEW